MGILKYRTRPELEAFERHVLADYAVSSKGANDTRLFAEPEHEYRTAFQRDRDRIIHSRSFRRLKHKQQVFLISDGDHYRTRLTHTLEVSQLSRTMARTMGVNEDLVEAIALGHDLGHTPYGHSGEVVLNAILSGKDDLDGLAACVRCGGFKHNYQSLRIVDFLEKKYSEFDGLNLTSYVREGILKHTRLKRQSIDYPEFKKRGLSFKQDMASTLEGQLVALCDEIAQRTHDLEDGIRAGHVELKRVRELEIVNLVETKYGIKDLFDSNPYAYRNALINGLIDLLIMDAITSSLNRASKASYTNKNFKLFDDLIVNFSDSIDPLQNRLDMFIRKEIIDTKQTAEKTRESRESIRMLFKMYFQYRAALPEHIRDRMRSFENNKDQDNRIDFLRLLADHIAGMTDRFVELEVERLKELYEDRI